ncbi:MAG: uroporphyrinogen decarboxylase family protein [Anaerolineae bacterium]
MQQKRKGVEWHLAVPPEVRTEYAGTTLGDYYSRAEVMVETQKVAREQFLALYGVDIGGPYVDCPAYVGVSALGADLVLPHDHPPMVANQGHVIVTSEQVMALRPADPRDSEWLSRSAAIRQRAQEITGSRLALPAGQEGPLTSAVLLRGEDFYRDLIDEPKRAHHLLDVVTQTLIDFVRYCRGASGDPLRGNAGIADDMAGTLSPALWPEFVVPYWKRIYEELGPGRRSLHTELLRPAHLHFLTELGIDSFDPGNDQYLSLEDVLAGVGDMRFAWNLYTVRDTMNGTPESIRALYSASAEAGAPVIMTELCRATPRANITAFVETARQYE